MQLALILFVNLAPLLPLHYLELQSLEAQQQELGPLLLAEDLYQQQDKLIRQHL
jgi:hypothetical protein